ncbi:MAG: orotidine-5'-phosphate decarboxylase [Chloroflexi bacterium]|nr:MAG: orotidine-5'-phosphate decarboxylase [Chloroflexota bacterium]
MAKDLRAEEGVATARFGDRLAEAVERKRSQLVVGLDPQPDLLPVELRGDSHLGREHVAEACSRFCRGLVDAVAPYVVAVKPQLAFFEALGADGIRAFEEVCAYARAAELLVIADGKRGDVGSTARAYAAAYLERGDAQSPLADALTVNPYLGRDAVEPFLAACRRDGGGVFCVLKTSNAGGREIQDLALSDGRPLWHEVARLVREWGEDLVGEHGLTSVGAVVGATHPRAVGEARRALPQSILLLPGVGAQGATPADLARAFASGPASALVAVSRSLIYAFRVDGADWRTAAGAEAARLQRDVWAVAGW